MTWAAGAPTYAAAPAAPAYVAAVRVVRYAGFWRRYWGLYVDQTIVGLLNGISFTLIGLFSRAMLSATASCETEQRGQYLYKVCRPSQGLAITFMVLMILVGITIWYRVIPRRLADGATPGMNQMGLQVQNARDGMLIGLGAAIGRSLLPAILQLGALAVVASIFLFSYDPDAPVQDFWWWAGLTVGLVLAAYGAALWTLVDRRHQTLYDKIVGSVVIEERAVNWWAVASFGCAMTSVLAPLAIVFGHIGLHQLADPHNREAGHGLAMTGAALGYVITILGVLALALLYAAGSN